ncbi:MAG: DUF4177 domain-containing protein [Anaerolineales bacterium]|nr:DUF4177 domain-containing protein [Anaerolineales bacterium]
MAAIYEYKFVRLGEGLLWPKNSAEDTYQQVVHQHSSEGWRLVQIFSPGIGINGLSRYYELIFEREQEDR